MSNRRWWQLGRGIAGGIGETYHYFPSDVGYTACGIKLPKVYGKFVRCADSPADQRKKRCPLCIEVRLRGLDRRGEVLVDPDGGLWECAADGLVEVGPAEPSVACLIENLAALASLSGDDLCEDGCQCQ